MNLSATLTGSHLRTYRTIFQHPVSHNLGWHDVHALFRHVGHLEEEANGNLKVTRNGQVLVLHPSRTKEVAATEELMALRHFLERSETAPPEAPSVDTQWLVVIDHHEARVYRSIAVGTVPQLIKPHLAEDFFRHAPNSKDFSRGKELPNPGGFFEPVAGVLNGAGKILLFGGGTGRSSEMDQFVTWLKAHRPQLAKRIIGAEVVDEHHLSEAQLLAKARAFYANHGKPDA